MIHARRRGHNNSVTVTGVQVHRVEPNAGASDYAQFRTSCDDIRCIRLRPGNHGRVSLQRFLQTGGIPHIDRWINNVAAEPVFRQQFQMRPLIRTECTTQHSRFHLALPNS